MKFADLHVLHIYQYSKPSGKSCPLAQFTKNVNPLMMSTCMRHIYIFTSDQLQNNEEFLTNLIHHLDNPDVHQIKSKYDYIQNTEAYSFLLYWVLGGLNPKKPFNDIRILGDLRNTLRNIETSNSVKLQYTWQANKLFAICLLKDSKNLLEWTQTLPDNLSLSEKEQVIKSACNRCTWAQEQGLLALFNKFVYANFGSEELMTIHIHSLIALDEERTMQERNKIRERTSPLLFLSLQSIKHIDERLNKLLQYKQKFGAIFQVVDIEVNAELVRNHNT